MADALRQVVDRLDQLAAQQVVLATVDPVGRLKGKVLGRPAFEEYLGAQPEAVAHGCAYLLTTDVTMRPVTGWDGGFPDTRLGLDLAPERIRLLPVAAGRPPTAWVYCAPQRADGSATPAAPAEVLARQTRALADMGITASVGLEVEAAVYLGSAHQRLSRRGAAPLEPLSADNRDYDLHLPPALQAFVDRAAESLALAEVPVEAWKAEAGPGQIEVTQPPAGPDEACRRQIALRQGMREVADHAGVTCSFMANPVPRTGNGLHVHVSMLDADGGNVLGSDGDLGCLSGRGRQIVHGVLEALHALPLLWAPNPNSYRRIRAGGFAPTTLSWGYDNRTCAVRVVGDGASLRLEVRVAGADANPYLTVAAVLAGVRHGLDLGVETGRPVTGNAVTVSGLTALPRTLTEAVGLWEDSPLPGRLLGRHAAGHYAAAARHEDRALADDGVPDTELRRYLARL